ncbi:MAG: cupredoxin domain-containing protein [Gemmatimonadales bacterium]
MTTLRRLRSASRRTGFALTAITLLVWLFWGAVAIDSPRHSVRHVVRIGGMAFTPSVVEVAAGDTIIWYNDDIVPHTATASREGSWDTGTLAQGGRGVVVAPARGSYPYFCRLHPTMTATVVVR